MAQDAKIAGVIDRWAPRAARHEVAGRSALVIELDTSELNPPVATLAGFFALIERAGAPFRLGL